MWSNLKRYRFYLTVTSKVKRKMQDAEKKRENWMGNLIPNQVWRLKGSGRALIL